MWGCIATACSSGRLQTQIPSRRGSLLDQLLDLLDLLCLLALLDLLLDLLELLLDLDF